MREEDDLKKQFMWLFHNTLGHPVMEACWWLGYVHPSFRDLGKWVHDSTAPEIF